jgi:queuine tRNA-ribosyltransferase
MSNSINHELVFFPNGSVSVKPRGAHEPMHSPLGPWGDSQTFYIGPCRLEEKLSQRTREPLVLWDLGMGLATNALAALEVFQSMAPPRRPIHIVSFERDLDGIRLALENLDHFPFLRANAALVGNLIANGRSDIRAGDATAHWSLTTGDFLGVSLDRSPPPEIVLYDFYTPNLNPEPWTKTAFAKVYDACLPRKARGVDSELFTFSTAASTRTALAEAGFDVAVRATSDDAVVIIVGTVRGSGR